MPDSLLKTSPENQLASSCFPVVALLLVERSAASPDFASSCCKQVTHPCQQGPTLISCMQKWAGASGTERHRAKVTISIKYFTLSS